MDKTYEWVVDIRGVHHTLYGGAHPVMPMGYVFKCVVTWAAWAYVGGRFVYAGYGISSKEAHMCVEGQLGK